MDTKHIELIATGLVVGLVIGFLLGAWFPKDEPVVVQMKNCTSRYCNALSR